MGILKMIQICNRSIALCHKSIFSHLSRPAGPSEDNDKLSNQNENEDKYEARITDDDTDNAAANLDGRDDADSDDNGKISDDDDIIHPV